MTRFKNKCDTYNPEVEANRKLIRLYKVIVFLPAIFLGVLGIALFIAMLATKAISAGASAAFLIFVVVGLLYGLIMNSVLNNKFEVNNGMILDKFNDFYKVPQKPEYAHITADNKGIVTKVNQYGPNQLLIYIQDNSLFFVTSGLFALRTVTLRHSSSFEDILKKDFGALVIPIDDIDNYKDTTVMITFKDSVLKITFDTQKFLDNYIPTKDFYFNADKKGL